MKVILSIKPYYAEKILNGEKKYELRKTIFKDSKITNVVIYASSPISRVVGEFEIERIFHEELDQLWMRTKELAGVERVFFDSYFADKKKGYAIKIKSTKKYGESYDIQEKYGIKAPQSFSYIKE